MDIDGTSLFSVGDQPALSTDNQERQHEDLDASLSGDSEDEKRKVLGDDSDSESNADGSSSHSESSSDNHRILDDYDSDIPKEMEYVETRGGETTTTISETKSPKPVISSLMPFDDNNSDNIMLDDDDDFKRINGGLVAKTRLSRLASKMYMSTEAKKNKRKKTKQKQKEAKSLTAFKESAFIQGVLAETTDEAKKATILASLADEESSSVSSDEDEEEYDKKTFSDEEFEKNQILADDHEAIIRRRAAIKRRCERTTREAEDDGVAHAAGANLQRAAQMGRGVLFSAAQKVSASFSCDPTKYSRNLFDEVVDIELRVSATNILDLFLNKFLNLGKNSSIEDELDGDLAYLENPNSFESVLRNLDNTIGTMQNQIEFLGKIFERQESRPEIVPVPLKIWQKAFARYGIWLVVVLFTRYQTKEAQASEEKISQFGWRFFRHRHPANIAHDFIDRRQILPSTKAYFMADLRQIDNVDSSNRSDLVTTSEEMMLVYRNLTRLWICKSALVSAIRLALNEEDMKPQNRTNFKKCKKLLVQNSDIKGFCTDVANGIQITKELYAQYTLYKDKVKK